MDKWKALHNFWNSFNIPAYDEATVPENHGDFYITYNAVTDSLDRAIPMSANIWKLNTTSWSDISQKAEQISDDLKTVKTIPLDIGYLYITRGQPFAQRMQEENDTVRRIYINIMTEYLTP